MIEIKIDDREFTNIIEKLIESALDLRPVMRQAAGIMHHAVEENFAQEGRPRWSPLSPKTIKERERKGYWPGKILQRRGELVASISQYYDREKAIVGTNKVYARIHQFGGKAGRGHKATIPPRPFLQLTEQDLSDIKEAFAEYLKRVIK